MAMDKNQVLLNVLGSTEDLTEKAWLLLHRLSERCKSMAHEVGHMDFPETPLVLEVEEFLFEISHSLSFVGESLEDQSSRLGKIRQEAV